MAQEKSVNNFSKGLSLSADNVNHTKDTYSYALNAIKEDSVNAPSILTNEKGFTVHKDLGYDYILVGSVYLGKEDRVLFVKNIEGAVTKFNKIVLIREGVISTILDNIALNFQDSFPIRGTFRINYKNEIIIYWVDGLNEDRFLNIDNGIVISDLDNLSIDIKYVPAILSSKTIKDNDGNLRTGAYEFFGSYISEDNATTPWFLLSATPSYIIDESTQNLSVLQYITVDGTDSNVVTTKSIDLNIVNLDSNFKKIRLGIIKTINGVSTGYYVDNIGYLKSTKTISYTGFAEEIEIGDTSQFVVDQVRYYASNAITQSTNRLLRANTKSVKLDVDYQSFANNIEVNYYIDEELVMSVPNTKDYNTRSDWWKYANSKYSDKKSLMRDEVYNVGIAFGLIAEGVETPVYHIPGRSLNTIPTSVYTEQYSNNTNPSLATWDSNPITENGETIPRWKVENTAALSTDGSVKKMGYWESEETYPDDFNFPITGSTTNGIGVTNIRHHKAPSTALEPLYRLTENNSNYDFYKRNIGISFSNIKIPDALKNNVSYIRIYIAPRTSESNKSIIAKGIFTNTSLTKISINDNNDSSSNYWVMPIAPYNDQDDIFNDARRDNSRGSNTWDTITNKYHSFYSPDTTLKNPIINIDRITIEREIKGIVHYYNTVATKINVDPLYTRKDSKGNGHKDSSSNGGYKRDLFFNDDNKGRLINADGEERPDLIYNLAEEFKTTYKSIAIFNGENKVLSSKGRRKVKQAVYVPFNGRLSTDQLGGMDNPYYSPYGSANVLVELDPTYNALGATQTEDTSFNFKDNDAGKNFTNVTYSLLSGSKKGTYHFHTIDNPVAVYRYGALKRTNNTQYGTIEGTEYLPTDLVAVTPIFNVDNTLTTELKGLIGDAYVDPFSVKRTRWFSKKNHTYLALPEIHVGVSTFFTESNVNHRLRYAEGTEGKNYYPKAILTTPIKEWLDDYDNIVLKDNYYKYNSDFNKDSSKRNYGLDIIDLDLETILSYPTRILYSEKLLDEERSDSYRVYLANNYRDLPKNKGSITHLFTKNQELIAITRDSIWKIFASNQTIKTTSEDNITVGTGEFFSLDPVEFMSIEGGYAGSSSKMGLVETPYGYFYCDRYKGRFILFDEQQKDLSLVGVTDYIKENYQLEITKQITTLEKEFDNPLSNYGYTVGFEPITNRILVTKLDYKFTTTTFLKYKGRYNPATTYTIGDIYLKDDGLFYTYQQINSDVVTIYESSNLSNFTPSTVNPISYTFTNPVTGTAAKDPLDSTKLIYTPVAAFVGTDTFSITSSCLIEPITVTVQNSPTVPDYNPSIPENSPVATTVTTITGTYTDTLTYEIVESDDVSNVFSINSTTGVITVIDPSTLNFNIKDQYLLQVGVTGADSKYTESTVTIDITPVSSVLTGINSTVTILDTTLSGTIIKILPPATYVGEQFPSLLYTLNSESTPDIFDYDLDEENNLTVALIDNASLNPATLNTYTITFKVEDNNNSAIFDLFTLIITVLYDPDTLTNEPGDYTCSTSVEYYNVKKSGSFQKVCSTGSTGSYVTYIVPANTYSSSSSQAAADNLAQSAVDANGQTYANANGTCLVNSIISTLVVDMYYDNEFDVGAYIDTIGVAESNNIADINNNFYPIGSSASDSLILASDKVLTSSLRKRFQFNIGKLISMYPNATIIPEFTFKIRGRSNSVGLRYGVYSLKYPFQTMIMTGSDGSYIPTITPGGGPTPINYSTHIVTGGDGTIGLGIGDVILSFKYNRALNTVSITTY